MNPQKEQRDKLLEMLQEKRTIIANEVCYYAIKHKEALEKYEEIFKTIEEIEYYKKRSEDVHDS